jgi:hypothetical protein
MSIYIYRTLTDAKRTVLIVLFIPSVERDGKTAIDQEHWVIKALETFGKLFGGATAFPKARGVWRDDANKGKLVFDEPVVFHCYTSREQIEDDKTLDKLRAFCRRMGKGTNQGEIGLVIDGEYLAITDY